VTDEQQPAPQAGIPEATVWEKIGKQSVEIDLLREKLTELMARNAELEALVAELTSDTAEATDEPANGSKSRAKAKR